ncbi:MAG: hypothetical protein ACE366_07170 [Bradymonadia bacterium]
MKWLLWALLALTAGCSIDDPYPPQKALIQVSLYSPLEGPLRVAVVWSSDDGLYVSSDTPLALNADGLEGSFEASLPPPEIRAQLSISNQYPFDQLPQVQGSTPMLVVVYRDDGDEQLTLPSPGQLDTSPDLLVGTSSNGSETGLVLIDDFETWFAALSPQQTRHYYQATGGRYTPLIANPSYSEDGDVVHRLWIGGDALAAQAQLMCEGASPIRGDTPPTPRTIDPRVLEEGSLATFGMLCGGRTLCALGDVMEAYTAFITQPGIAGASYNECYDSRYLDYLTDSYQALFSSIVVYTCDQACPCQRTYADIVLITLIDDPPPGWPCTSEDPEETEGDEETEEAE